MTFEQYLDLPENERIPLFKAVLEEMDNDVSRLILSLPRTNKEQGIE